MFGCNHHLAHLQSLASWCHQNSEALRTQSGVWRPKKVLWVQGTRLQDQVCLSTWFCHLPDAGIPLSPEDGWGRSQIFIYCSSAFNTIQPMLLGDKL